MIRESLTALFIRRADRHGDYLSTDFESHFCIVLMWTFVYILVRSITSPYFQCATRAEPRDHRERILDQLWDSMQLKSTCCGALARR
jgi:hypothetical protein